MEKLLNQLVDKLLKAYGDHLVSVVLYGSAAFGANDARFSDLNILCVLTEITPSELAHGENVFRWWREQGSPSPLLLSEAELESSTDCFPIEFHDILRHYRVLHGRDVIAPLQVGDAFYRAQVEHDLRARLLRLRQKAAGVLSDHDLLRRLLVDSLSTFCVLFRHALMLHGVEAVDGKREIIARASEQFGFDPGPFSRILDLREERLKPREVDPVRLFGGYLAGITAAITAVDRLEK